MTKLKGLLLTEGKHGMISQVEGLARALDVDFIHEKIELNSFWKLLPPKVTPIQDFVFKNRTQAEKILVSIIKLLNNDINILPSKWRDKIQKDTDKKQTIVDYVCGMTDQYAINFYNTYAS